MSLEEVKEFCTRKFPSLAFREFVMEEDDDVIVWTAKVRDPLTGERGWVTLLDHWPEGATIDWT